MDRREILKYTALATGAALSAPLLTVILSGCKSEPAISATDFQPKFFSAEQFQMVSELVDVILPKTDSPSASEVGVHKMMDHMAMAVFTADQQKDWKTGFGKLAESLSKSFAEKGIAGTDAAKAVGILNSLEKSEGDAKNAFMRFKQQTIAYYLSSKEVGTKFLNYLPVPGEYKPCIKLSDVDGKAWAI